MKHLSFKNLRLLGAGRGCFCALLPHTCLAINVTSLTLHLHCYPPKSSCIVEQIPVIYSLQSLVTEVTVALVVRIMLAYMSIQPESRNSRSMIMLEPHWHSSPRGSYCWCYRTIDSRLTKWVGQDDGSSPSNGTPGHDPMGHGKCLACHMQTSSSHMQQEHNVTTDQNQDN